MSQSITDAIFGVLLETTDQERWDSMSTADQQAAKNRETSKYHAPQFKVRTPSEKSPSQDSTSSSAPKKSLVGGAKKISAKAVKTAVPVVDGVMSAVWDETLLPHSSDAIKNIIKLTPDLAKTIMAKFKKSDKKVEKDIAEVVDEPEKVIKSTTDRVRELAKSGAETIKDIAKEYGGEYQHMYGGMKALLTKRGKGLTTEEKKGIAAFARVATIAVVSMGIASPEMAEAGTVGAASIAGGLMFAATVKAPLIGATVGVFAERVLEKLKKTVKSEAEGQSDEDMIMQAVLEVLSEQMDDAKVNKDELLSQLVSFYDIDVKNLEEDTSKTIRYKDFVQLI